MATPVSSTHGDFYVYALFRETGVPFYIGKGRCDRWNSHERQARASTRTRKCAIIRNMQKKGVELIKVKLHDGLTENVALQYEIAMIAAIGRFPDGPLMNRTDGGEVGNGCIPTQKTRAKMSAARFGKVQSAETRAKASSAKLGKPFSAEARANMSSAQRGRTSSEKQTKHLAKMSAENLGRKKSPEQIERHAAIMRGRKHTEEHRANNAAARRGKKRSPESVAKGAATRRANNILRRVTP